MAETPHDAVADIAVHQLGGTGRTLLISHATGFHGHCYDPMVDTLRDHFRCVSFDYRGHGDTPSPAGWQVDWDGYADDAMTVASRLAATSDEPLVGFGHSMGATCLLMCAHQDPEMFSTLILFEPIVLPPEVFDDADRPPIEIAERTKRRRATYASLDEAYANFASKPPLDVCTPAALRAYVDHGFRPTSEGVTLKCTPAHEAATFEMGQRQRTWELLPKIETPCVIVTGRDEGAGPSSMAAAVADRLPNAELVRLDELDHFGPMSEPAKIAQLIIDH